MLLQQSFIMWFSVVWCSFGFSVIAYNSLCIFVSLSICLSPVPYLMYILRYHCPRAIYYFLFVAWNINRNIHYTMPRNTSSGSYWCLLLNDDKTIIQLDLNRFKQWRSVDNNFNDRNTQSISFCIVVHSHCPVDDTIFSETSDEDSIHTLVLGCRIKWTPTFTV